MDIVTIVMMVVLAYISFQSNHIFIGIILLLTAAFLARGESKAVQRVKEAPKKKAKPVVIQTQPLKYPEMGAYQFKPNWPAQDLGYYMTEQIANAVFIPFRLIKYIYDQFRENV